VTQRQHASRGARGRQAPTTITEPPTSRNCPEAEAAVVAACLLGGSKTVFEAAKVLGVQHFTDPSLAAVYAACLELQYDGGTVDLVTVADSMRTVGRLGDLDGGTVYLSNLLASTATDATLLHHAKIVYGHSLARQLAAHAARIQSEAQYQDPDTLLEDAAARIADLQAELAGLRDDAQTDAEAIWTFEDVADQLGEIAWLWPAWMPQGFLCLLAGRDGIGKSKVALSLAGSVIRKAPWPDSTPVQATNGCRPEVLYIDTEGSQAVNLARLRDMCIPLGSVYWFKDPRYPEERMQDIMLDDPLAFARYERVVRARKPTLVVFDAFRGLFSGDENSSRDTWFLKRIAALCRDTHVTGLLLQHVTKRRPDEPVGIINLDSIRGSTAIRQCCRSIMALDEPDPESAAVRFRVLKVNVGPKPPALGLEVGQTLFFSPRAPEPPHKETTVDRVKDLLLNLLAHGPVAQGTIREQVEAAGFSWGSARRAKDDLGIVAAPERLQGGKGIGRWIWALPARVGQQPPQELRTGYAWERSEPAHEMPAVPSVPAVQEIDEPKEWWDR